MNESGTHHKTRILLVDDSPELLSAWSRLLSREPDLELVGCFESLAGLNDAVRSLLPDVVVLDVSVGERDGVQVIPSLKTTAPNVRVVVYSGRTDSATVRQAQVAGAAGFIGKHQDPKLLLAAIRDSGRGDQARASGAPKS